MRDYIEEIRKNQNEILNEFAEYIGRKIDFYRFYDDHFTIEIKRYNNYFSSVSHYYSTFEVYPFVVKLNKSSAHEFGDFNEKDVLKLQKLWRKFASKKFPDYKKDLENAIKSNTQSL